MQPHAIAAFLCSHKDSNSLQLKTHVANGIWNNAAVELSDLKKSADLDDPPHTVQ